MHRVLRVAELVDHILSFVVGKSSCQVLLDVSLTCHALLRPALDYLWGSQLLVTSNFLLPLVVAGALKRKPPKDGFKLSIARPLSKSDWERFLPYARRIKRMYWVGDAVEDNVLATLSSSCPSDFLFPNLVYLSSAIGSDSEPLFSSSNLLSPALSTFNLQNVWLTPSAHLPSSSPLDACFSGLAARCPRITRIALCFDGEYSVNEDFRLLSVHVNKLLATLLQSLKMLKAVAIHSEGFFLDPIAQLAALPHLTKLNFSTSHFSTSPLQAFTIPHTLLNPFPRLEVLSIDVTCSSASPQHLKQLIRLFTNSPLQTVAITWSGIGPSDIGAVLADLNSAQDRLLTYSGPKSLTLYSYYTLRVPDGVLPFPPLYPLSHPFYHQLARLHLKFPLNIDFEDEDLMQLSRWLPWLEDLYLGLPTGELNGVQIKPRITFSGFLAFMKSAWRLRVLALSINFGLESAVALQDSNHPTPRLQAWNVLESVITQRQAPLVTRALEQTFPHLRRLDASKEWGIRGETLATISEYLGKRFKNESPSPAGNTSE